MDKHFIPSLHSSRFLLLALLLGMGLGQLGCEKELPFSPEVTESKLVVNSFFAEDSLWHVSLSQSLDILDTSSFRQVQNGVVEIQDANGNLITSLVDQGNGDFTSATEFPQVGPTYRVQASAPGFATVSSTSSIPGQLQGLRMDTTRILNPDSSVDLQIDLHFQDPLGEANFYIIEIIGEYLYIDQAETLYFDFPVAFTCTDPNIDTDNQLADITGDSFYDRAYLRDAAFDGQAYTLRLLLPDDFFIDEDENFALLGTVSFTMGGADYFNYRRSVEAYENSVDNPFAQPTQVFTNVEGGFGIFAGRKRVEWPLVE